LKPQLHRNTTLSVNSTNCWHIARVSSSRNCCGNRIEGYVCVSLGVSVYKIFLWHFFVRYSWL